ncbi:josephin-1-like [Tropilaelaps mercedesae]|uniref:ubiquitinyl hydrolase 1 n=1 Tax=Tropilaelaps mercedesae TaxID=418985 RepID=A0A1V9XCB1_9ACAR|nr:josephin-1-like [Tropilaelaps mercedesae]
MRETRADVTGGTSLERADSRSALMKFVDRLVSRKKPMTPAGVVSAPVYHERQLKELCALHALNNLFQDGKAFNKHMLDQICHSLSPDHLVNPHKSVLGLGNYDVNVIMAALQSKGFEAIWFDKRKDPSTIDLGKILGFILNVPNELKLAFLQFPLSRKHWVAVREVRQLVTEPYPSCEFYPGSRPRGEPPGLFFNLDSKLDAPMCIGGEDDVIKFLRDQAKSKEREIFIVVRQDVGKECYKPQLR